MGCDLIGYTVIGDKDLAARKEAAIEQAAKVLELIKSGANKFVDGDLAEALSEEEAAYFSASFADIDIEYSPEMLKDKLDYILVEISDAKSFVSDFLYFWKYPHNRDTNYRYYGDKQIIFAGGESYGEEPTGHGYTMLKLADMLDLFPVLNIE